MKPLLLLSSFLLLVSCRTNTAVQPPYKSMMIKSVGEVEVQPDMASFYVNLSCIDKSIEQSKQCLVSQSKNLHSKLIGFGIEEKDLQTGSVTMNKSYIWNNGTRIFEGYRSTTQVFVTIRNIDKLDDVYTSLLGDELLELAALNYSHSKMDSLKNEAYINALDKSMATVDKLLENLPESKKEVMNIGNVEINTQAPELKYRFGNADRMEVDANQTVAISPGIIRINATLFVEYRIR